MSSGLVQPARGANLCDSVPRLPDRLDHFEEHEHQRRIEEQIRLSNMPSSGNLEMPEDGSGMTASQRKRAKKKGKRKAQPKAKARREEL